MKTPEEIEGSLKPTAFIVGIFGRSAVVREDTLKNALAYIQQLKAELSDEKSNHQHAIDIAEKQKKQIDKLKKVIVRLNKERNAAVADLKYVAACETCKEFRRSALTEPCIHCTKYGLLDSENKYEWRGVKEDIDND